MLCSAYTSIMLVNASNPADSWVRHKMSREIWTGFFTLGPLPGFSSKWSFDSIVLYLGVAAKDFCERQNSMLEDQLHHTSRKSRGRSGSRLRFESKTSPAIHLTTPSKSQPVPSRLPESSPFKSTPPKPTLTSCLKICAGPAAQIMAPPGNTVISISTSFQVVIPQISPVTEVSTSVTSSSISQSGNSVPFTSSNATSHAISASHTSQMIVNSSENVSISTPTVVPASSANTVSSEASQSPIPPANANSAATSSTIIKKWSIDAKVGAIIGIVMLFLTIAVLSILFCTRKRRRLRLQAAKVPSIDPQSIFHTPVFYNRKTSTGSARNTGRVSLDSAGIRWPEKVMLSGEAKEIHDLTKEFEGEYKNRRPLSCTKKREESQMVLGRIEVGHLKTKKLGRSW